MDDLSTAPLPPPPARAPAPIPPPPGAPPAAAAPGRPAADPAKRDAADARYQLRRQMADVLPPIAKEPRVAVYRARNGTDTKSTAQPLKRILYSDWKDLGLSDTATLRAQLREEHGPGRYVLETQDNRNVPMSDVASFVVDTREEGEELTQDAPDADTIQAAARAMQRTLAGDPDNFALDNDPSTPPAQRRANLVDMLASRLETSEKAQKDSMETQQSMIQLMMMKSQEEEKLRREEDRRRDEREEARRREEREEEKRREDRENERRREDDRRREEREERRREEDRKAEAERREADRRAMEQAAKRTEMLVTAGTAVMTTIVPVLAKLFDRKEDPVLQTVLANTMNKSKDADPLQIMLLKHVLDKGSQQDGTSAVIASMAEMSKISSTMMTEQIRQVMGSMNDINQMMLKKALEASQNPVATEGGEDDDDGEPQAQGIVAQIAQAISGLGQIAQSLGPAAQPQGAPQGIPQGTPGQMLPPGTFARPGAAVGHAPVGQPALPPPQRAPDLPGEAPQQIPGSAPAAETIERSIPSTLAYLRAIQMRAYRNDQEQGALIEACLTAMPDEMIDAIIRGDQATVTTMCFPVIMGDEEFKAWFTTEGVAEWVIGFANSIAPMLPRVLEQRRGASQPGAGTGAQEAPIAQDDDDEDSPV